MKNKEVKLEKHQVELLENMSKETIRYFGALMIAFEIPNYWECKANDGDYEYVFRIDKKKI